MKSSIVLATMCIVGLLASVPTASAQQVDCFWEPNGCIDPWTYGNKDVWVQLSATPPCSIRVTVHYMKRCNQIEFGDYSMGGVMSPPACTTQSAAYDIYSTPGFLGQVNTSAINQIAADYVAANGGTSCCPCPNSIYQFTSKYSACAKVVVRYLFPDGSTIDVDYDPNVAWSYYESLHTETGGIVFSMVLAPCNLYVCCKRATSFCVDEQGQVRITNGPWEIDPLANCASAFQCKFSLCGRE